MPRPTDDTRAWLIDRAATTFAYLTTTGRLTGDPHRIEIWFGVTDGRIFLMSGGRDRSDWVKNLIASPTVSIEIDGEVRDGIARVIQPDEPEDAIARQLLVAKYQKTDELQNWKRDALPVIIAFPPEAAS